MFGIFAGIASVADLIKGALGFGTNLTNKITELKVKQVEAKTQEEKDILQAEIDGLKIKQAQQAAEASQNAQSNQIIRFLFVLPVGLLVFTLLAWDKVACKFMSVETQESSICTTDPINDSQWWIVMVVICFYFLEKMPKR